MNEQIGRPKTKENRPTCPLCNSNNIVKTGTNLRKEQRWFCNDCGKSWTQEKIVRELINKTIEKRGLENILKLIKELNYD